MDARRLTPGKYGAGELCSGDWYVTPGITVTEAHILAFAGLSGDFFDVHMDDEFARSEGFPSRIAHGLLVLSLIDGLKNRADVQLNAIASLGWNWSFKAPIRPGDRLSARICVVEVRRTSKLERSVVVLQIEAANQVGRTVQEGRTTLLMRT